MTNKPIFVCLKSAVDKQMQISSKSNVLFLPKMGWVVKIFSCIVWILLNQPNCFVNESVYRVIIKKWSNPERQNEKK